MNVDIIHVKFLSVEIKKEDMMYRKLSLQISKSIILYSSEIIFTFLLPLIHVWQRKYCFYESSFRNEDFDSLTRFEAPLNTKITILANFLCVSMLSPQLKNKLQQKSTFGILHGYHMGLMLLETFQEDRITSLCA